MIIPVTIPREAMVLISDLGKKYTKQYDLKLFPTDLRYAFDQVFDTWLGSVFDSYVIFGTNNIWMTDGQAVEQELDFQTETMDFGDYVNIDAGLNSVGYESNMLKNYHHSLDDAIDSGCDETLQCSTMDFIRNTLPGFDEMTPVLKAMDKDWNVSRTLRRYQDRIVTAGYHNGTLLLEIE